MYGQRKPYSPYSKTVQNFEVVAAIRMCDPSDDTAAMPVGLPSCISDGISPPGVCDTI